MAKDYGAVVEAELQAAVRDPPQGRPNDAEADLSATRQPKMTVFDPDHNRFSRMVRDPIYDALNNKWRDRQHHGRLAYEAMLRHPVPSSAFSGRMAIISAHRPHYRPTSNDPTKTQKEIVDLANFVVEQLDWGKFITGPVELGYEFGFSLTEMTTKRVRWKGRTYIVPDRLLPLPQATLDSGMVPREELGELALGMDPRYRCFKLDDHGTIKSVHQFASWDRNGERIWKGRDLQYLLHFKHKGGDGNPFGESALFPAFDAWASLYALEKIEEVFLDTSFPVWFGTYDTKGTGVARPAVHAQVEEHLEQMDLEASKRLLMWADGDLKSVAPSNPNFTEHIVETKKVLREYIWQSMLFPRSLVAESSDKEGDARNLIQVFFKHLIKADLLEVGGLVDQIVRRIIETNYSNLSEEDYPRIRWSVVTENEIRVAQSLLGQITPLLDSEKVGEIYHRIFSFLEPDDFPSDHEDSVQIKRAAPEVEPDSGDPPPKEEDELRVRDDGDTENLQFMDTSAAGAAGDEEGDS